MVQKLIGRSSTASTVFCVFGLAGPFDPSSVLERQANRRIGGSRRIYSAGRDRCSYTSGCSSKSTNVSFPPYVVQGQADGIDWSWRPMIQGVF